MPRKPSIHVVDQVRYLVLYKAKLDAFREKLPVHRASISAMQDLIETQSPRERRKSTARLEGIVKEQKKAREKDDEYEKAQEEVVNLFEERLGRSPNVDGEKLNTGDMLKLLEDDLVEKGMERKEAEQALFPITKVLLRQPFPPAAERHSSLQKPEFKLHLFDVNEESEGDSGRSSDPASVGLKDSLSLVSPDEVDDELEDIEPIKIRPEGHVVHEPDLKPCPSPVSFLARRRPLLETRTKSSGLILPST